MNEINGKIEEVEAILEDARGVDPATIIVAVRLILEIIKLLKDKQR